LKWKYGLTDQYIWIECDEDEEMIAEHYVTKQRVRWNGQFWENC
jgi:hypothetical protein